MSFEPYSIVILLVFTMGLFIWGRWRHDIVALIALMLAVVLGAVPFNQVYSGLGNVAVITVACVMVISASIRQSGVLDVAVGHMQRYTKSITMHVGILTLVAAVLSSFMNNVGALALLMPVAIQTAIQRKRSPSLILMPIALGSALGGLTTLIGTPPNLLVSNFRQEYTGQPYNMFDFSYVGLITAIVGVVFIALFAWRLIPKSRKAPKRPEDIFQIGDYITEIRIPEDSPAVEMTVREFESIIKGDFILVGIIRKKRKRLILSPDFILQAKDILIIESGTEDLQELLKAGKLELVQDVKLSPDELRSDDVALLEAVVPQASRAEAHSSSDLRMRGRFRINLLAIARHGLPITKRLHHIPLRAGDVVLLQGRRDSLQENAVTLGFLPLIEHDIQRKTKFSAWLPLIIFGIAILFAALQILPVQIAFSAAVLFMVITNVMPVRKLYESVDWSIIVLLAAMIPIGNALQSTGGTALIAHYFIILSVHLSPKIILLLILIVTMTLSDFMNNAATAVVMAPISASIAQALNVNVDPFLMAVAIGASCSFLTPVGHQNNTLVMGPGGYKFTDYIRVGLPLEILVIVISFPLLITFWPLK